MTFKPTQITWIVFLILTVETLLSVPLLSWELALGGRHPLGGACFALAMLVGVIFLIWRWRETTRRFIASLLTRFEDIPIGVWLAVCFGAGVVLRVLWVWQFPAPQRSDQATYFALARGLVENHRYGFSNGGLAYWPPGFPLFLALWFFLLGFKPWVPLLANVCLFGGTLVAVERLAMRIGGPSASRLATLLLVPWPTMVMIVGFAGKELLVVFLLCLVLLTFSSAMQCVGQGTSFALVGVTGLLLGAMSLTQPSFMLFAFVLIVYDYIRNQDLLHAGIRGLVAVAVLCTVILPWTLRNHRVLGEWVPVSTNGGDVFYRANNPLATGGYTPKGEQDLDSLDEVSRGKVGFRLGKDWIRQHPGKFLVLAVRKQILFLGDDAQGAFETLKRGLGIGGIRYASWKAVSNLYWLALWALILLMMANLWRTSIPPRPLLTALMLSALYLVAIHSVFESGGKYHEPLMGIVAVLAAQVVAKPAAPVHEP